MRAVSWRWGLACLLAALAAVPAGCRRAAPAARETAPPVPAPAPAAAPASALRSPPVPLPDWPVAPSQDPVPLRATGELLGADAAGNLVLAEPGEGGTVVALVRVTPATGEVRRVALVDGPVGRVVLRADGRTALCTPALASAEGRYPPADWRVVEVGTGHTVRTIRATLPGLADPTGAAFAAAHPAGGRLVVRATATGATLGELPAGPADAVLLLAGGTRALISARRRATDPPESRQVLDVVTGAVVDTPPIHRASAAYLALPGGGVVYGNDLIAPTLIEVTDPQGSVVTATGPLAAIPWQPLGLPTATDDGLRLALVDASAGELVVMEGVRGERVARARLPATAPVWRAGVRQGWFAADGEVLYVVNPAWGGVARLDLGRRTWNLPAIP